MKVIITGCEYTGASTLARDFCDWLYDKYGGRGEFPPRFSVHDHFEIPDLIHAELDDSERDSMVALAPKLTEAFQRYNVLHHTPTLQSCQPAVEWDHGAGRLPPGRGDIRADVLRLRTGRRAAGPQAVRPADR